MDDINRELGALSKGLKNIEEVLERADSSRKLMWDKLSSMDVTMAELRYQQKATADLVQTLKPHVDEFVAYKTNVQGAGKLGRWLWIIGGYLLALAAWFADTIRGINFK